MTSFWTDGHRHNADCYVDEPGPGGHRRIHRPEPCVDTIRPDCLHLGARPPACASCGTALKPEPASA